MAGGRSPGYPSMDLKEAIDKARVVHGKETGNAANVDTLVKHWNYSNTKVGAARQALSALGKYGLMDFEGSKDKRSGKLTQLAIDILIDKRSDSKERAKNIQTAALTPDIFKEIWREYKGLLPSDENLEYKLRKEKNFTERGAKEFIQNLKATITFANLSGGANIPDEDEGKTNPPEEELMDPQPKSPKNTGTYKPTVGAHSYTMPIPSGDGHVYFSADCKMNNKEWERMVKWLDFIKPGLVDGATPEDASENQSQE